MILNLHSIIWHSKANGPGNRIAIWFQGCSIHCPGCFNPLTHDFKPNTIIPIEHLAEKIIKNSEQVQGITISGGEPFDQQESLFSLVSSVKDKTKLSIIILSGYTYQELEKKTHFSEIIKKTDVLIAGPYHKEKKTATHLAGSSNKTFHFFSDKYSLEIFENLPTAEIKINTSGDITISGIDDSLEFIR